MERINGIRERNRLKMRNYRATLRTTDPARFRKLNKEHNWRQANMRNQDQTVFTIVDYDRLYQVQQGKCALCARHQSEVSDSFCVDHDHVTLEVRGLLCRRCNSRINIFDDLQFTKRVEQYLKIKVVKEN